MKELRIELNLEEYSRMSSKAESNDYGTISVDLTFTTSDIDDRWERTAQPLH